MRKTYAYNSIIFGFLLGLLVGVTTESVILGILAGLGVSVVGFIVIRLIENAIHKGVEKAADKISETYRRRKEQKAIENGTYRKPVTTQMPVRTAPAVAQTVPTQMRTTPVFAQAAPMPVRMTPAFAQSAPTPVRTASAVAPRMPIPSVRPAAKRSFCIHCGAEMEGVSRFCSACGKPVE